MRPCGVEKEFGMKGIWITKGPCERQQTARVEGKVLFQWEREENIHTLEASKTEVCRSGENYVSMIYSQQEDQWVTVGMSCLPIMEFDHHLCVTAFLAGMATTSHEASGWADTLALLKTQWQLFSQRFAYGMLILYIKCVPSISWDWLQRDAQMLGHIQQRRRLENTVSGSTKVCHGNLLSCILLSF